MAVKNPFLGTKNPFAGATNPFAGVQNPFGEGSPVSAAPPQAYTIQPSTDQSFYDIMKKGALSGLTDVANTLSGPSKFLQEAIQKGALPSEAATLFGEGFMEKLRKDPFESLTTFGIAPTLAAFEDVGRRSSVNASTLLDKFGWKETVDADPRSERWTRNVAELGVELLVDPLNFIGGGVIKAGVKAGAQGATELALREGVEAVGDVTKTVPVAVGQKKYGELIAKGATEDVAQKQAKRAERTATAEIQRKIKDATLKAKNSIITLSLPFTNQSVALGNIRKIPFLGKYLETNPVVMGQSGAEALTRQFADLGVDDADVVADFVQRVTGKADITQLTRNELTEVQSRLADVASRYRGLPDVSIQTTNVVQKLMQDLPQGQAFDIEKELNAIKTPEARVAVEAKIREILTPDNMIRPLDPNIGKTVAQEIRKIVNQQTKPIKEEVKEVTPFNLEETLKTLTPEARQFVDQDMQRILGGADVTEAAGKDAAQVIRDMVSAKIVPIQKIGTTPVPKALSNVLAEVLHYQKVLNELNPTASVAIDKLKSRFNQILRKLNNQKLKATQEARVKKMQEELKIELQKIKDEIKKLTVVSKTPAEIVPKLPPRLANLLSEIAHYEDAVARYTLEQTGVATSKQLSNLKKRFRLTVRQLRKALRGITDEAAQTTKVKEKTEAVAKKLQTELKALKDEMKRLSLIKKTDATTYEKMISKGIPANIAEVVEENFFYQKRLYPEIFQYMDMEELVRSAERGLAELGEKKFFAQLVKERLSLLKDYKNQFSVDTLLKSGKTVKKLPEDAVFKLVKKSPTAEKTVGGIPEKYVYTPEVKAKAIEAQPALQPRNKKITPPFETVGGIPKDRAYTKEMRAQDQTAIDLLQPVAETLTPEMSANVAKELRKLATRLANRPLNKEIVKQIDTAVSNMSPEVAKELRDLATRFSTKPLDTITSTKVEREIEKQIRSVSTLGGQSNLARRPEQMLRAQISDLRNRLAATKDPVLKQAISNQIQQIGRRLVSTVDKTPYVDVQLGTSRLANWLSSNAVSRLFNPYSLGLDDALVNSGMKTAQNLKAKAAGREAIVETRLRMINQNYQKLTPEEQMAIPYMLQNKFPSGMDVATINNLRRSKALQDITKQFRQLLESNDSKDLALGLIRSIRDNNFPFVAHSADINDLIKAYPDPELAKLLGRTVDGKVIRGRSFATAAQFDDYLDNLQRQAINETDDATKKLLEDQVDAVSKLVKRNPIDALTERMRNSVNTQMFKELYDQFKRDGLLYTTKEAAPKGYRRVDVSDTSPFRFLRDRTGRPIYVHPELLEGLQQSKDFFKSGFLNDMMGGLERVMNLWRQVTYLMVPQHYINNFIGNFANNAIYGVKTSDYSDALKMLKEYSKGTLDKQGMDVIEQAMEDGVLGSGFTNSLFREFAITVDKAGREVADKETFLDKMSKRLESTKYAQLLSSAGQRTDDWTRFALYLRALRNTGGSRDVATDVVRKYLFNYRDMTVGDRFVRATMLPFWMWMKNNIPLQVETLLKLPKYYATADKLREATFDDSTYEDLPTYIKERGVNMFGMNVNLSLPMWDASAPQKPFETFAEGLQPFAKAPLELAMNKQFFNQRQIDPNMKEGEEMSGEALAKYLARTFGGKIGNLSADYYTNVIDKEKLTPTEQLLQRTLPSLFVGTPTITEERPSLVRPL